MMRLIGNILCLLGLHKWYYTIKEELGTRRYANGRIEDMKIIIQTKRVCLRCKRKQIAHYPTGMIYDIVWHNKEEVDAIKEKQL